MAQSDAARSTTQVLNRLPWWVGPITVTTVLIGFGIYVTVSLFFLDKSEYQNYLSPFYSPPIGMPDWLPSWLTPALFILWIPLGFRGTCYYYRKAYYRSFFWDPPACSSKAQQYEPRSPENYKGETMLFVLNNIHRYFLYGSLVVLAFLWYDTVLAFLPGGSFGISLGSIIFLINVSLISAYTLSCHSLRHLIGGSVDCYSCVTGGNARRKAYNWLSVLNRQHALWAWLSLFALLFTDIYIRLLIAGVISDPRII